MENYYDIACKRWSLSDYESRELTLMFERRIERRKPSGSIGRVRFGANGFEVLCTVSDYNSHGAGLKFGTTFGLPSTFQLIVEGEHLSRHCRVVWSDGKRIGVIFE